MTFDSGGNIVLKKPVTVIEDFLLARVHMFRAVYYHKTINAFDALIERIYRLLIETGLLVNPAEVVKSGDETELAALDDYSVYQAMVNYARMKKRDYLSTLIEMFLSKRSLTLACDETCFSQKPGIQPLGYSKIVSLMENPELMSELVKEAEKLSGEDISEEWIIPFVSPKILSVVPEETPFVVAKEGRKVRLSDEETFALAKLVGVELYDAKIYTRKGLGRAVNDAFQRILT